MGLAGCAPKENKGAEEANAETGSTSSDWLGSEPTVQESDIVETIDTEFLIVALAQAACSPHAQPEKRASRRSFWRSTTAASCATTSEA